MNQSAGRGADHVKEMAGSSAAAEPGLELATGGGLMPGTVFPLHPFPWTLSAWFEAVKPSLACTTMLPRFAGCHSFLEEEGRNLPGCPLHGGTMCPDQSQGAFDEAQRSPGKRWILTP